MNHTESLAYQIGCMSNRELSDLALELVRMHSRRSEYLASYMMAYEQDELRRVRQELDLVPV
jgi:hypothetical protein